MAARPTLRWFFWLSCVLAACFCARTASADAPMCDARGMSIEAPPPVMPIRDARIEGAAGPLCRDEPAMLRVGHQMRRGATFADAGTIETWLKTESAAVPTLAATRAPHVAAQGLVNAPGYDAGVFRPPRAA